MMKLRINPLVTVDLKNIREYIAEDNPDTAQQTVQEIYSQFENVQYFPSIGAELNLYFLHLLNVNYQTP